MSNQTLLSYQEAQKLIRIIKHRYQHHNNKQLMRLYYCNAFKKSERTFYRKIKDLDFNQHELIYLHQLLTKGDRHV